MTRLEEHEAIVRGMAKVAELDQTGTYEGMVAFQLGEIVVMLADISKSLAILADKAEGSEEE